jgi:hypothetical protein
VGDAVADKTAFQAKIWRKAQKAHDIQVKASVKSPPFC